MNVLLWGVLPYVVLALLVGGTLWRYRYDQFGWTTRSTQLYESRLLHIGSPLFHFGLVFVLVGHIVGLVIPKSWTEALGVSQTLYHVNALVVGGLAGFCTLLGVSILVYRRRKTGPVFMATTRNDKAMYVALVGAIVLGLFATLAGSGVVGEEHNYRETVSVWFRSLFVLQPDVDAMAAAPWTFHVHVLVGHAAVRDVAVHPARARVHGSAALPLPPVRGLPQPRRPPRPGQCRPAAWLGSGGHQGPGSLTAHARASRGRHAGAGDQERSPGPRYSSQTLLCPRRGGRRARPCDHRQAPPKPATKAPAA